MRFVETPIFTRTLTALLDEEQCRALQRALALRPEQGDLTPQQVKVLRRLVREEFR